jgi:hypothetical protein
MNAATRKRAVMKSSTTMEAEESDEDPMNAMLGQS